MAWQRIATEKLLPWFSYFVLKQYGMPENYITRIAGPGLIPRFEAVWHVRELQHKIC
jgi:hypothetical protein